jgi:lysophospholipase L1-like esterase/dienelactone hydrolase
MTRTVLLTFAIPLLFAAPVAAQPPDKKELPRIVLIGDSIRLGYAPLVAKRLEGKAVVVSAKDNGGDSANVLKNLDAWAVQEKPDLVHFNAGLHDLKRFKKDGKYQVDPEQYERDLKGIVSRLRKDTSATIIYADTTPIHDERHAKRGADFDRTEADVQRYNKTAVGVMKAAGIPVDDLHGIVVQHGADKLLGPDGTHYTKEANEILADAVTDCLLRHLTIRKYQPLKAPAGGKEAAEAYRKKEKEYDALVPEAFKKLPIGKFQLPTTAGEWQKQRPDVHRKVVESLGDLPPRPTLPKARTVSREIWPQFTVERVALDNGVDGEVSALLVLPPGASAKDKRPAVLWLHSSTPDKTQVLIANTNGGPASLAEEYIKLGWVVLSPDAYWHGDRVGTGPAGTAETGNNEQQSLLKYHLWMGRTLWGMFVRDDQVALDYLCSRPDVDVKRIGATGMSMGSTRAWWLAAVDDRVHCTVGVACLTRYENLIKHGQLRQHGVYYFVNGLLKHFDIEGVLALIAPRPYLALTGDLDAGSPADGIRVIEEKLGKVYEAVGARENFRNVLYPDVGHSYTPQMRAEMLTWFEKHLR